MEWVTNAIDRNVLLSSDVRGNGHDLTEKTVDLIRENAGAAIQNGVTPPLRDCHEGTVDGAAFFKRCKGQVITRQGDF